MTYRQFKDSESTREDLAIEYILEEATSFCLREEVQTTARKIIQEMPAINILTAYEMAFNEWIK